METITFIVGLGIFLFLLVYMIFKFSNEHVLLQFGLAVFIVFLLILLPKTLIDYQDCSIVVQNQTEIGNTTSFNYQQFCVDSDSTTATTLYKSAMWFLRFFVTYMFVYMIWVFLLKDRFLMWGWLKKK